MRTSIRAAVAALGLCAATAAVAQTSALPPAETQGAITYLSGGIGDAEAEAIKAEAARHPLAVTFATRVGTHDVYLATIPVVIRSAGGETLLDVIADGPYLLVDLPAGSYRITAKYKNFEKNATVQIAADRTERVTFVWAADEGSETGRVGTLAPAQGGGGIPPGAGSIAVPTAGATAAPATVATASPAEESEESELPAVKTQGGLPYITGGIGAGESAAMKAAAGRYPLAVTLAIHELEHDVFLGSLPVTVRDAAGTVVLDVVTDGPYLLAELPPGTYRVAATYNGQEKQSTVRVVAGRSARVGFVWPMAELESPASPR